MNDLNFAIEKWTLMNNADDMKIHITDPNPQVVVEGINRDLANTLRRFRLLYWETLIIVQLSDVRINWSPFLKISGYYHTR